MATVASMGCMKYTNELWAITATRVRIEMPTMARINSGGTGRPRARRTTSAPYDHASAPM